jgi:hypothetical protein
MAVISSRHATRLLFQRLSKPSADSGGAVRPARPVEMATRSSCSVCARPLRSLGHLGAIPIAPGAGPAIRHWLLVAAGVAEELSLLPDRGGEQPQARRQDREDRQPHHVAPMTAIGRHVRYGIQVPASCLETTTTEAAPAATPRMSPVRSRITVCQIVMDSSCRVVAPTRRSRKSALSPFDRGHTSVFTSDHDPADAEQ